MANGMRPWIYNALAGIAAAVLLLAATAFFLALMFTGSAFRISNITHLAPLSAANLKATLPLALIFASVGAVAGCIAGRRRRG
jgi:hypothetical protein